MTISNFSKLEFKEYEELFIKLKSRNRFSRLGKTFKTTNKNYFYDAGTGKVFEINNNLYKVLECLYNTDSFDQLFKLGISTSELLSTLNEIKECISSQNILQLPPVRTMLCNSITGKGLDKIQMRHISFEMTERCNLRCKYCIYHEGQGGFRHFGNKDITFDIIKKTIDLLSESSEEEVYISFYGGEPLIKFELIKQCVSYCNEKLKDKKVCYNMTTNCTLITDEIANYLSSLDNYFTTVSLDGPELVHDKYRVFPDGSGSFNKTIEGLKKLVNAEGDRASERINFNIVLSDTNSDLFNEIQEFFKNNKYIPLGSDIRTSYVSTGNKDYDYFGVGTEKERNLGEYKEPLTTWSFEKFESGLNSVDNNTLISKDLINKELSSIHKRVISDKPVQAHYMNGCCVPSARRLYVTVNGDFAVCERIGPSPFIGNVDTGIDIEKIEKHFIKDYEKEASRYCNDCWAVTLCGLCYINCYDDQGIHMSYRHPDCIVNRRILENNFIKYHEVLEQDPEALSYLNDIVYV